MKPKIKDLKVDFNKIPFKDPKKVHDGTNGKILETAMEKQGFRLDKTGTLDMPLAGVEIKSRGSHTKAMHTIGTMTYDNIISTSWDDTPFKQKLQTQYRVTIKSGGKATGKIVNLKDEEIQKHFRESYEDCRAQLKAQGKIIKGQTITSGQYGALEHKPGPNGTGKSFAFRIPESGMKKILGTANLLDSGLFEYA